MTARPGTRLGPYEVLSPLGAGGMGEVYRARDTRIGRDVAVKVLPALYSADPDRLRRFEQEAAGERGPLLVAQCDQRQVLSDIKLVLADDPELAATSVTVLARLGLPDERIVGVPVVELDRAVVPDHLTSLWIPRLAAPVAAEVARFAALVRELRARCPWDREQTRKSLRPFLIEEAYEVLEAIESGGVPALREELGDLLFQVVFHAQIAAERGEFDMADVLTRLAEKMVTRHPHVFGADKLRTADEVLAQWHEIKKEEKISQDVEAINQVQRVGRRIAESVGRDLPNAEWEFVVFESDDLNAFALPGGQVFITRALYDQLQTEGQLAGVLGHEIGHVVGRHSAEHIAKAKLTEGLTGAAVIAASDGAPNDKSIQSGVARLKYAFSVANDSFEAIRMRSL